MIVCTVYLYIATFGANVRFCRDEVCRITVCLACGSRSSEPRDRARWTLAPSVHQAGIDHGAWSRRRGNPHAYPPFGASIGSVPAGELMIQMWLIWAGAL
jgi:hypothetical protein